MPSVITTPRTVHVEHCMGTVFSLDIRTPGEWSREIADVVAWLHRVDRIFSTYRSDSQLSRLQRGALPLDDCDPDVQTVLGLCAEAQVETGGAFSALIDGRIDPTGLVKGWAVERASALLRARGAVDHALNGGGDIQLAGSAGGGRPWSIGITDPHDRGSVLATVTGRDLGVATSGTAERGTHLVDPFTGRAATALLSATVVGPSLTRADAYATAACVLGRDAARWIGGIDGYEALLVDTDGQQVSSSGWGRR